MKAGLRATAKGGLARRLQPGARVVEGWQAGELCSPVFAAAKVHCVGMKKASTFSRSRSAASAGRGRGGTRRSLSAGIPLKKPKRVKKKKKGEGSPGPLPEKRGHSRGKWKAPSFVNRTALDGECWWVTQQGAGVCFQWSPGELCSVLNGAQMRLS